VLEELDVQPVHSVRPFSKADPPGVGVRLDVSEERIELRGEFALHKDLGPAHLDDLGQEALK